MTVGLCDCDFMVEAVKGSLETMVENTVAVGIGNGDKRVDSIM